MVEKQLPGLSRYRLRSDGEVISHWAGAPKILKGGTDKDGYRKFVLIDDIGMRRYVRRASLICSAFHGPRPKGKEVRHIDGTRDNDSAENLAWATHKENIADKVAHGTRQTGERANNVKISEKQAREVKNLWAAGANVSEVMAKTGASRATAYNIKYGNSWAWL